ncbi:DELLA protein RGL2 [Euphorbia peplus]|nr:DELLA protein RGL2 [Euphorbia peplus]
MAKFTFHEPRDRLSSTNNTSETMEEQNGLDCSAEGIGSSVPDYGFCKDSSTFFEREHESFSHYDLANESSYNFFSPPLDTCFQEMAELGEILQNENQDVRQPKKTVQNRFFSSSLQLLNTHNQGMKRLNTERVIEPTIDPLAIKVSYNVYSTENIMRIAAERFTQSFSRTSDVALMLDNPFEFSLSGLPDEEAKKVELAELLMASAEKVGDELYDRARILLNRCDELSSSTGNAVERVVYYFSKALRERINEKTGKTAPQGLRKQQLVKIDELIMALNPKLLAVYQDVPFAQIAHSAGIQAVIENVTGAKKIHVIDLGIRTGVQWTGFMQTLASDSERPLKLLKITAVGTTNKTFIEDTGKRLTSFAESICLPFLFNILTVADMLELHEDQFNLEPDETVVVYSAYLLKLLIPVPDRLDYMMNVIRILKPSIMVVTEPELNSTSPLFVNRFVETVFYFSAYFDCLEFFMRDDPNREHVESSYFGESIKNILATEGEERSIRQAKLDVWRAFFARFGMVESELSTSSLLHGKLMAQKFACGNACSLELDGKSLFIGWKGTPLFSLSAWKFMI